MVSARIVAIEAIGLFGVLALALAGVLLALAIRRIGRAESGHASEAYEARIRAEDEVKERLSAELHDNIMQRLFGIAIDLELSDGSTGEAAAELRDTAAELRRLAHGLHPPTIDALGLQAAVELLVSQSTARTPMTIALEMSGLSKVPDAWELGLFRWIQEALRNALVHSQGTGITIELHGDEHGLRLCVVDDGIGIDAGAVAANLGIGLYTLQTRIRSLGGRSWIEPGPDGGTAASAWVPWPC